jgi:hypothetical protein
LAKRLLTDSKKLLERTLYISPQLKAQCEYLLGLANHRIFIDKVI